MRSLLASAMGRIEIAGPTEGRMLEHKTKLLQPSKARHSMWREGAWGKEQTARPSGEMEASFSVSSSATLTVVQESGHHRDRKDKDLQTTRAGTDRHREREPEQGCWRTTIHPSRRPHRLWPPTRLWDSPVFVAICRRLRVEVPDTS